MNNVKIHPCTAEDVSAISELEKNTFSDPWSEDSLLGMTDSEYYHLICAEADGVICGYIAASSVAGESEILRIAVSEKHRRRGIGAHLLDSFIKERTESGDGEFFLEVRASNTSAIGLYSSRGFEACGKRTNYYKCPTEDAVLMRLCTSHEEN